MTERTKRARFRHEAAIICAELSALRKHIDALGDMGASIAGEDRLDMLGCFASNTLYGAQALVEQMLFVFEHPKAKRARWP